MGISMVCKSAYKSAYKYARAAEKIPLNKTIDFKEIKLARTELPKGKTLTDIELLKKNLPEAEKKQISDSLFMVYCKLKVANIYKIHINNKAKLLKVLSKRYDANTLNNVSMAENDIELGAAVKSIIDSVERKQTEIYQNFIFGEKTLKHLEELKHKLKKCENNIQNNPAQYSDKFIENFDKISFEEIKSQFLKDVQGVISVKDYNKMLVTSDLNEFQVFFQKIIDRKRSNIPFHIEQEMYKIGKERNDLLLDIFKATKEKSSNKRINEIEKILMENYNIKFADLGQDEAFAEKILEGVKFAKLNKIDIPDNIICSNVKRDSGEMISQSNLENTVIINSSNKVEELIELLKQCDDYEVHKQFYDLASKKIVQKTSSNLSTNHPLHVILHEFNHIHQNMILSSRFKQIPKEFEETYKKLSTYASNGVAGEVEAELLTKKQLGTLSGDEERLLQYLA